MRTTRTNIENKVKELNNSKSAAKAKAWWNGLSTTQKVIAIGVISAIGSSAVFYFALSSASGVTATAVATSAGPKIAAVSLTKLSTGTVIGGALIGGAIAGVAASNIAHNAIASMDMDESVEL